jgi:Nitrogenase component 1 type Oxidoreductase
MQLTVWTYEGPPHVGAMRIAAAMKNVHYVLHAPQGDTYADLLFTMIERRNTRPPVTYTTFQARDLGGDTAELFKTAARDAYERFKPEALIVGSSCTAELIQDDPGGLAQALDLPIPVIPLELPAYQRKENWGAAETFYRIARALVRPRDESQKRTRPSCNILGPTTLGFRHRDDLTEITALISAMISMSCSILKLQISRLHGSSAVSGRNRHVRFPSVWRPRVPSSRKWPRLRALTCPRVSKIARVCHGIRVRLIPLISRENAYSFLVMPAMPWLQPKWRRVKSA